MEQRFFWDRERIAFFHDAAENSPFYRQLAEEITPVLRPEDHILDAGCGLGYLSAALIPYCRSVTAVDRDPIAVSDLMTRAVRLSSLHPITADVQTIPLSYDVIVCCRFGSTEEALRLFRRSDARMLVLIKRNAAEHRIAASGTAHTRTAEDAVRVLKERLVSHTARSVSYSFNQPFRSMDAAIRFYCLYRNAPPTDNETKSFAARLEQTGDPVFPLVLPIRNELTIFFAERT